MEDKPVVGVPPVVGLRPIVVQPQPIVVVIHVENVRVAIAVSFMQRAIHITAHLILRKD